MFAFYGHNRNDDGANANADVDVDVDDDVDNRSYSGTPWSWLLTSKRADIYNFGRFARIRGN